MKIKLSIFAILLGLLFNFSQVECRGKRIDIFNQGGKGDIVQLRSEISEHTVLRNALPQNSQNKWDRMKSADGYFQIPYIITGDYDSGERDIISGAMKTIEENTCIRFVPRNGETDFIDIQNQKDEGCYTNVGRDGGQNVVMLEANSVSTCVEPDIVIHELLHTIGLWHEHMRADRDDYIKVLYKNIEPAYFAQFTKVTSDEAVTYGIPYDYTSVMHYGETAFARSGEISMRTNDQRFQKVIGHQRSASQSDYKKVCMIYSCPVCKGANSPNQPITPPVVSGNGGQVQATYRPYITSGSSSCRGNRLPEFMCNVMISNGIASCESQKMTTFCCSTCQKRRQITTTSNNNFINYQNNNNGYFARIFG